MSQLAVEKPNAKSRKKKRHDLQRRGDLGFDAQKNVACGQRAACGDCCIIQAIAIHATPASANPSKANKRFRAFLFPCKVWPVATHDHGALALRPQRRSGTMDRRSTRTRRPFKLANVLPRPGGSSPPAEGRNPQTSSDLEESIWPAASGSCPEGAVAAGLCAKVRPA